MRYEKRLQLLKDLFNTTDNLYVQRQLEILGFEIELSIMDAQINVIKDNLNTIR